jgi:hypothetical protein
MAAPTDNLDNIHGEELLREQIRMLRRLDDRIRLQQVKTSNNQIQSVVMVDDVTMSVGNMITFMIKWFIASIPVAIIIGTLFFLGSILLTAIGLSSIR